MFRSLQYNVHITEDKKMAIPTKMNIVICGNFPDVSAKDKSVAMLLVLFCPFVPSLPVVVVCS